MAKNKIVFETFRSIGQFEQAQLTQERPSCFNREIQIKKYRITVEEIEEPKEVYVARLKELGLDPNKWL